MEKYECGSWKRAAQWFYVILRVILCISICDKYIYNTHNNSKKQ